MLLDTIPASLRAVRLPTHEPLPCLGSSRWLPHTPIMGEKFMTIDSARACPCQWLSAFQFAGGSARLHARITQDLAISNGSRHADQDFSL